MKIVRVGSRESKLAIIQAEKVIQSIESYDKDIKCELVTMSTSGDKDLSKPLDEFQDETLFTSQLDRALLDKEIDIAVHSFKDLPIYDVPELPIVALSVRENPFDCLVLPKKESDKAFGCSCERRELQFLKLYPDKTTANIRGSVDSRVKQLDEGDYGGLILAVAGLKRLGLEDRISKIFTSDEMVPSACQGVIAVQGRQGEDYSYLKGYDSPDTHYSIRAERAFIRVLNEDNSSYNNGVYAEVDGERIKIVGMYILPDKKVIRDEIEGSVEDAEELGKTLAENLLKRGV